GVVVLPARVRSCARARPTRVRRHLRRAARDRRRVRVRDRAAGRSALPDELRQEPVHGADQGPRLHRVRRESARRDGDRLRAAAVRRRAHADRDPADAHAPPQPPHRLLRRLLRRRGTAGRRPRDDDARDDPVARAVRGVDLGVGAPRAPQRTHRLGSARATALKEVSADWVLPVDEPPIDHGLVRYEGERIVEVGPGRAERHFDGAAILPGFVNAHSHLEYASYAGFGDGTAFGPWLKTHIERKGLLQPDDMLGIARLGVAESLRSGITTTADYSFSGAAADATADLGLRAVVYLEVFAADPRDAERQWVEKRGRVSETSLVTIGVSPHAPYTCSLETYRFCLSLGVPVGTHLAESAHETQWLLSGEGPLVSKLLVPPTGKRPVASLEPVLGPELLCAHCVQVTREEIELLAE